MDISKSNAYSRREFIGSGFVLASAALTVPAFIQRSAQAMTVGMLDSLSSQPGVPEDHILLVIQMGGGNDGLNTVIPYGSPEYYKARPGIGVPERDCLKLSGADGIGLHPQLTGFKDIFDQGGLAIIQGIGYPNPNRSHFKSMDIWHTADVTATGDGWLGKYFDAECCGYGKGESGTAEKSKKQLTGKEALAAAARAESASGSDAPGIAIGRSAPLAMQGRLVKPISFESADLFKWSGSEINDQLKRTYDEISRRGQTVEGDKNSNFLMRTALDAQVSSDLIRKAVNSQSKAAYPGNDLARQLKMIASMIRAGLKTRVYYAQIGGFDTHAGQGGSQGRHGNLINQVAASVKAFYADLKSSELDGKVLTMTFSEFGRRVGQNASGGTDHGTAAPMFLAGPMVKGGVYGEHPSLKDLDEGDLKFNIDFRTVYAGVLDGWLKTKHAAVLGGSFQPLKFLKKA